MAKTKQPKPKGVPNKHLHARTTFLYQAATYLTLRAGAPEQSHIESAKSGNVPQSRSGLALQMASDLHTVSRKGQVRLSSELKRSICKTCYTSLIPGRTATQTIENDSRGGKKPWADVLVMACTVCGTKKRFPVGAKRQLKKSKRRCLVDEPKPLEQTDGEELSTTPTIQTTTDHGSSPG
ncbi:Rpr2-domain-containing protein [Bimuria novae-zelandiae CBS 107.79]|uniref:Rpr2-domain-containing protein n=1 Tax=Bimuria novae-zelandiae CBS 107.79 TaxID=1447943 RepID=A0A6A5VJV4_9PLEO|nr:Rpr2-domain-containing protein [Bimuria novae-zelandiae CBS 107.79]